MLLESWREKRGQMANMNMQWHIRESLDFLPRSELEPEIRPVDYQTDYSN